MRMKNCSPRIEGFIHDVEEGRIRACREVWALIEHVKRCFENEDIYVNNEQLEHYLAMQKYFPYDRIFPWQQFIFGLHLCTYRKGDGMPRWPDLFCLIGRGAGKDGMIAMESVFLTSPYNGIREYDVDICANNEEQAIRPVKDIVDAFEGSQYKKKLQKFYKWLTERVTCTKTNSRILGRTNNPKSKDGLRSGIVIFNEIHQYEDYKNINVFTTGLGKKKHPRRGYFTTQGDVREGPLDNLLERSERIFFDDEPDHGLLPFICRLDSDEEVHDPANWEKANPSLPYLPDLKAEIEKEYHEWQANPHQLPAFMTKRMNRPSMASEMIVTDYDNIKATNRPLPDLKGWMCTVGIDYARLSDFAAVNLHFRKGDDRFDINHAWFCARSKDAPRIKAPLAEWAERGLITIVDDVEIHPSLLVNWIADKKSSYVMQGLGIDDFRFSLMAPYLKEIGFDEKAYKNLRRIRPSDIMKVAPVIDSCFNNQFFTWGDNPALRWATNNTKLIRYGRKPGKEDDADLGNYVYGKIEAKSRKTDPFMALAASMCIEDWLPVATNRKTPDIGVFSF